MPHINSNINLGSYNLKGSLMTNKDLHLKHYEAGLTVAHFNVSIQYAMEVLNEVKDSILAADYMYTNASAILNRIDECFEEKKKELKSQLK